MPAIDDTDIAALLGPTLIHVTAAGNLPSIAVRGLRPAADLAQCAALHQDDIILRKDRRMLQTNFGICTLNHQRPIVHGTTKQGQSLDQISPHDWARQLDRRVFFWPSRLGQKFTQSIAADTAIAVITIDTGRFLDRFGDQIDLCPINSGNFRQGGAHTLRGPWIYVPARLGRHAFRINRQRRGLVKNADSVKEVSLCGTISADDLAYVRGDHQINGVLQ